MIFRRPSNALQTPFQTIFELASHALLFLQTPFRRPSHTSPIPPYACALPLGRTAHAKAEAAPVSRTVASRLAQRSQSIAPADRGLTPTRQAPDDRSHTAVRNEIKKPKKWASHDI
jgi:hypothetical protein